MEISDLTIYGNNLGKRKLHWGWGTRESMTSGALHCYFQDRQLFGVDVVAQLWEKEKEIIVTYYKFIY